MGVSNVSFGLPSRDAVNSTFFTLAMEAGLSCAIINPQSKAMLDAYYAYRALKGLDGGCKAYVKRFADSVNKVPTAAVSEYTLHLFPDLHYPHIPLYLRTMHCRKHTGFR